MNNNFDWIKYNLKRNEEAIKIHKYNIKHNINFLEKGVYINVRDIYALALLISKNKKKETKILDYGGNLMPHVNLKNKINTKNLRIFVYNPYLSKKKETKDIKIKYIDNLKKFKKTKFDLTYFGSVLQYIFDLKKIKNDVIENSKYILITHTPIIFSKESYIEKQKNVKNLDHKIHTYSEINSTISKKFNLIFKSINEYKYSGLSKKRKNAFSTNLLFKKK